MNIQTIYFIKPEHSLREAIGCWPPVRLPACLPANNLSIYIYIYIHTYVQYTYIYIYIYREREREREIMYIYTYIHTYIHIHTYVLPARPPAKGTRLSHVLYRDLTISTANVYTYTPIVYDTVYIILIRHCKHLLVVVYKSWSCTIIPPTVISNTTWNFMSVVSVIILLFASF